IETPAFTCRTLDWLSLSLSKGMSREALRVIFGCVWVFRAIRVLRDGPTRGHSPGLQTRHEAHGHSLTLMIASWYCNLRSRSQHGRKMRYLASAYRLFKGLFR